MCGIFGILAPEADDAWIRTTVKALFRETEIRGTDASGIAYLGKGKDGSPETRILKKAMRGKEFQLDPDLEKIFRGKGVPKVLIGHCRKLSMASADNNNNNHPIPGHETDMALVHNGKVTDFMWRATDDEGNNPYINGEYLAEVDSESIMRLLETMLFIPRNEDLTIDPKKVAATPKEEWPKETEITLLQAIDDTTFNLQGKNTCAVLDSTDPLALHFWRVDNPLFIAYIPKQRAIVFASVEEILKKALTEEEIITIFDFIEVSRSSATQEYKGSILGDGYAARVEFVGGDDGKEFVFDWITLTPGEAEFDDQVPENKTVSAGKNAPAVVA